MKGKLIAVTAAGALALGSVVALQAEGGRGHGPGDGGRMWRNPLEHLTKDLELTPDQQAKVSPIVEQAKPQIRAIHQEAMQKTHAVMESTVAQIRPLLTAEQQQKLDRMRAAHEKMREAMREMHEAKQQ